MFTSFIIFHHLSIWDNDTTNEPVGVVPRSALRINDKSMNRLLGEVFFSKKRGCCETLVAKKNYSSLKNLTEMDQAGGFFKGNFASPGAASKGAKWPEAVSFLQHMEARKIRCDAVSSSTVVHSSRWEPWELASALLMEMVQAGRPTNVFGFNAMLSAEPWCYNTGS